MGSAILAAHTGIGAQTIRRDASYIQSWRDAINADKPMIIRSATLGQRAVDLILNEPNPNLHGGWLPTGP